MYHTYGKLILFFGESERNEAFHSPPPVLRPRKMKNHFRGEARRNLGVVDFRRPSLVRRYVWVHAQTKFYRVGLTELLNEILLSYKYQI